MTNGDFADLHEIQDIESHNVDKMAKKLGIINPFRWHLIRKTSRDNARTPVQWDDTENGGFTTGKPWLQVNRNHTEINVEKDMRDPGGVRAFYKKAIALKKSSDVLLEGSFEEVYAGKMVYVFRRRLGDKVMTAVCSFSKKQEKLPVAISGEVVLSNYDDGFNSTLRPYEFRLVAEK